jgi:hypothetical protein
VDEFHLMPPGTPLNGYVSFDGAYLILPRIDSVGFSHSQSELQRAYHLQQLIPPEHLDALLFIYEERLIHGRGEIGNQDESLLKSRRFIRSLNQVHEQSSAQKNNSENRNH